MAGSDRLAEQAQAAIADPGHRVYVSAASAWEIAIKTGLGKLEVPADPATWLPAELLANRFTPLAIDLRHAREVEHLPRHHSDPLDRLLIAQAATEGLAIVTGDSQFERYDIPIIRC